LVMAIWFHKLVYIINQMNAQPAGAIFRRDE
jgi:hypothetical protein